MNVLFIIDQVYQHGGIERVLSIKANYLAAQDDYNIRVLTTEQKDLPFCYKFDKRIDFVDLAVNYNRRKSYFHPKNIVKLPKHISSIRSQIKKFNPDVIVVCSHSTDTYFMPFIVKSVPKIKEFHYSKFIEEGKRNKRGFSFKNVFFKFADYVETKYDRLVVLNKDEKDYYKSDNIVIIPNPLTFFPEEVSKLNRKVVISAGRIAHVKGFDMLMDIWKLTRDSIKDWELHVYGDGDKNYINKLKNDLASKNIEDSFFFKGSTSNMQREMLNASIYAMSSHNECFPLVLLEAQACGLPIISFDCPNGPRNIVNVDNGILIDHLNNEKYADSLIALMSDFAKREAQGNNARINAENYSIEKVMSKWKDLFLDVIK